MPPLPGTPYVSVLPNSQMREKKNSEILAQYVNRSSLENSNGLYGVGVSEIAYP
jgi:hypothetical protein